MVEAGWKRSPNLKILVGGEAISREFADQLLDRAAAVWNMYGPTETTVWSTIHPLRKSQPILIGRPIANTQIYVLDRHLQPLPFGAVGEIFIGGDGVAVDYLSRPELTKERFIANPFGTGRIYRTGDLGRFHPDGMIEFLGRNDFQAKLRGYRIELGEIEAALREHPDVRRAAAYLWEAKADDTRLVACCVPAEPKGLSPISLRKHLRARLPDFMIPQHFLTVDEIPLTPNGKIDHKRLPKPAVVQAASQPHEPPSNSVEVVIAEIWTNLIAPARQIGRFDKFFELGGHSLLGVRALWQIEQRLGVRLPYLVLFEETLADIAGRFQSESVHTGLSG